MIYEPHPGEPFPFCACGSPLALKLYVGYKYPRTRYTPEAMDPWYVHGGGHEILTCGDPKCEPDALLAVREQIIAHHLRMYPWVPLHEADQHMAGLELRVYLEAGDGISFIEDDEEPAA